MESKIIIEKISEYYKLDISELKTRCRDREFVKARQITMYFLRELTTLSQARIGSFYIRDHATVLYACIQVRNLYDTDKKYRNEIDTIRKNILNCHKNNGKLSLNYWIMQLVGKVKLINQL